MGKSGSKFGLAVLAGAALGYAASLFVSKKTRDEHKKKLEESVDTLADKILKPEDKKRVQELFSSLSKATTKEYLQLKKVFETNLAAASKTWASIDKSKYTSVVEATIKEFQEKRELNKEQLKSLKEFFMADFEKFKENKQTTKKK